MKQLFTGFVTIAFLLLTLTASTQTDLSIVQEKLGDYIKTQLPEKVFLHTDKSFYTAGETVWFKLYVVDGLFNKPLAASKVAYVEILDLNNKTVTHAKIELTERGGNGSIQLPVSLPSGYYTIRSYTKWMQNAGAAHFFESTLSIVNPLKSPEVAIEQPAMEHRLQLFPEGGHLVNGLSSKVAFHITDIYGKGLSGKGFVIDARNDTITSFSPYKFGMGHFELTPQTNNSYHIVFQAEDGKKVNAALPKRYESGYTMLVEEMTDGTIKVTVKTIGISATQDIYLTVQTRQVIKAIQKNVVRDGLVVFTIDKKLLGEGVSQFTVFDNNKVPVSERLFFIQPPINKELRLEATKAHYANREKVAVSLHGPIDNNLSLSLSVYKIDTLQSKEINTIGEYFWLTSELHGQIEQPSYYFSATTDEVKKTADYLMLTHGWRRFKWESVLDHKKAIPFQREEFGHTLSAQVTDIRTNAAAENIQVFLSIPNTHHKLFTSISDQQGMVQFNVPDFYGTGEIVIQTYTPNDSFYKVTLQNPFAQNFSQKPIATFKLSPSQQSAILEYSIGMQSQLLYVPDSINRFIKPVLQDTLPFYGIPIHSYKLDDYVRFNTMEEVLREYVREVNVGVKGNGASLRFKLYNEITKEWNTDNFLVMADGIPLMQSNSVFLLNPLKIKQLDIISKNYILGNTTFSGIANFTSYSDSYEGLKLDPKAVTIDYEGLQLQREFYAPEYATALQRDNRLPDLRSTLLWIPNVNKQQLSFYSGDNKGTYIMVLQGIDADGKTISATSTFEVK